MPKVEMDCKAARLRARTKTLHSHKPDLKVWRSSYLLPLCPDKSGMKVSFRSMSLNFGAIFSLDRSFVL